MTDSSPSWKWFYMNAARGIQDFIFATSKLKEMIGASALVEEQSSGMLADSKRYLQVAAAHSLVFTLLTRKKK